MHKRHIVFDIDDTLVNSHDFNQLMFVQAFLPFLKEVNKEELLAIHSRARGKSMKEQFAEAAGVIGLHIDSDKLVLENEKLQLQRAHEIKVFAGVIELITHLSSTGLTLHICTNRDHETLDIILKTNNIHSLFTKIISCKQTGYEKPDPYCLTTLIDSYGVSKDEFLFVGDSKTDEEFARRAGVDYIFADNYTNPKNFKHQLLTALK